MLILLSWTCLLGTIITICIYLLLRVCLDQNWFWRCRN